MIFLSFSFHIYIFKGIKSVTMQKKFPSFGLGSSRKIGCCHWILNEILHVSEHQKAVTLQQYCWLDDSLGMPNQCWRLHMYSSIFSLWCNLIFLFFQQKVERTG